MRCGSGCSEDRAAQIGRLAGSGWSVGHRAKSDQRGEIADRPLSQQASLHRQASSLRRPTTTRVAILLSYGAARVLLAGDAEAREEEYMASGPYTNPLTIVKVQKLHTL